MPAAALGVGAGPAPPALARLSSLAARGMKLGLAAIDAACARLGRPERRVPSVLVAGTNGKGSTAATLSAIARACGMRAGLYTSPHLEDVTERVRLDERDVSRERLEEALSRVFAAADVAPALPLTYFEALTAAAFAIFAEEKMELSILEVGLGGRFDATNVAPARLSIVTSIALDHVEELGPTVESVAREKAGIFRPGRPALVGSEADEVLETFRGAARETGAELHDVAREVSLAIEESGLDGTRFRLRTPAHKYALWSPLPGDHQAWNATLAVRAAELLSTELPALSAEGIRRGVASVRWPGRLERLEAGGRTVLLDGCHNPDGAAALALFLARSSRSPRADLIFGAMADKDVEAMAAVLFPLVRSVRLVPVASARAATPQELARRVANSRPDARACASLEAALEELLSDPESKTIIVAGSLYLIGEARARLLAGKPGAA